MSGTPQSDDNSPNEDNDDEFYSPRNEGNGMLHCNPTEDNVIDSPALGIQLAAKFDSAMANPGSENSTISEVTVQPPKTGIPAESVLKGASSKGFEESGEATTATDLLKTPQRRRGNTIMTPSPRARNLATTFQQREVRFDEGYDSEGELGPFSSVVEIEGKQDFDEEALPQERKDDLDGSDLLGPSHTGPPDAVKDTFSTDAADAAQKPMSTAIGDAASNDDTETEVESQQVKHDGLTDSVIQEMKVADLKEQLRKRRCPVGGKKDELVARLKKAVALGEPVYNQRNRKGSAFKASKPVKPELTGFPEGTKWKVLVANEDCMPEPENPTFTRARAPTVPEAEAEVVPVKYNFKETFNRPTFSGTYEEDDTYANGRVKLGRGGKAKRVRRTRKEGNVNPKFIRTNKLTVSSHPADFVHSFLPFRTNTSEGKEYLSIEQMTKWTNLKAALAGAGPDGTTYTDYRPFTARETRQHLGLYIFNGLSPSPRVEMKFRPQTDDPVHGNDFVYQSFGPNAERRNKHFRSFFSCQNPTIDPPARSKFPNWKIRPLLTWMNRVFTMAWQLATCVSCDEQTIGFQGNHKDKRRITYKAEGDGFQCDALCQDGFTYQFYFRNEPAPPRWKRLGLSPLHSRVMALFDTLKDKYHQCGMDNLYNSVAFCKAAFKHPNKVLLHGVTRRGGRGIPACVLQDEVKNKKQQMLVRGTVKAAVLEGDPECPNLVASSVYDTKPVHFLSMICDSIRWIVKEKSVFNVETGKMETMRFLRLNYINDYNYGMGHVDVSDQLRNNYRFDHWLRNTKWWWSIFYWGLGVILVNAYVVYTTFLKEQGVSEKNILTHYNFRKAVALAWISPEEYYQGSKKSSAPTPPTTNKKKVKRTEFFTDHSVGSSGKLTLLRLNSYLPHFPVPPNSDRSRCGMHRWLGIDTQKDVMTCKSCNVNLCLRCYEGFHTIGGLVGIKTRLKEFYEKNDKKTAMDCYDEVLGVTTPTDRGVTDDGEKRSIRKRKPPWPGITNYEEV
jgi:hypothetical protein